MSAATFSPDCE